MASFMVFYEHIIKILDHCGLMCSNTENNLSNSQFLHLSKKRQCIFAGKICRPGTDIAESFHLSKNKFNHDRVCFLSVTKENVWENVVNF